MSAERSDETAPAADERPAKQVEPPRPHGDPLAGEVPGAGQPGSGKPGDPAGREGDPAARQPGGGS